MTAAAQTDGGGEAPAASEPSGSPRSDAPDDRRDGDAALHERRDAPAAVELSGDGGAERAENGEPSARRRRRVPAAVEWLLTLGCALVLALLLRAFLVEVFVIPSGSMAPTLTDGNRVAVYKLGYRLHDVNRGDVVVFKSPGAGAEANDLIKRVVALGGETFEISDGAVRIDGEPLDEPYLRAGEPTLPKLPIPGCINEADTRLCAVPEGKVLVLGDSREGSRDSRFFGPVDVDDIVGRAVVKIWPPNDLGGL